MIRSRKKERIRLIDDGALALSRDRSRTIERKPDAWFRSDKHLAWVRGLPCCATAHPCRGPVEAAHIRIGSDGAGAVKPSDYFTLPLCQAAHRIQHHVGERSFHKAWGAQDPIRKALEFALNSPCVKTKIAAKEEMERRYG